VLDTLTTLLQPWADLYSASAWLPTMVIATHVLALFAGGGIAIAADRRVLLARPDRSDGFVAAADELQATHGVVIRALVVMVLSGTALATADIGTFAGSVVFWTKMGAFALLIGNGVMMRSVEARLLTVAREALALPVAGPDVTAAWQGLRRHAWVSLAGWFVVVLLGVVVANV
jgi:hypothetical protein